MPRSLFERLSARAGDVDHVARSFARCNMLQLRATARGDISACPYACRGLPYHDAQGTCVFGCWDEPSCITNGPPGPGEYGHDVHRAWAALDELSRSPVWRRLTRRGRVAPPPHPEASSPA